MSNKAFEPAKLGSLTLSNHIVMAPMTRSRALGNIPNELMAEYYRQRATAGLIITEGTSPAANGLGYARIPGLFNQEQVTNWQRVTETVHHHGGHIFVQLMHAGRIFHPHNLPEGAEGVAPSAIAAAGDMWTDQEQMQPQPVPRAIRTEELAQVRDEYVHSAKLAIEAGFDGVELHGANGYLLEQFLNPNSNQRTDGYGGSVQNRARFVLEVARAVVEAIGAERTGIRLSPWGMASDMAHYPEIDETYAYLAEELQKIGVVYLHLVDHSSMGAPAVPAQTVTTIRQKFTNTLILSGGYSTLEAINEALESGRADLVAVGRPFIANPDFVERLKTGAPLAEADQATLYAPGPNGFADGYIDYPLADGQPAGTFSPSYQA
ncbi:alkene reductase [Hymenobacter sp. BT770]|uniref:alkene reductase n=1 Tax=Hymenobacter sp. BT770 TaxID=2886942 RepID=UPI001D11DA35|nr:alkene reductase [Hymenobacter sp. BT770]MCC3151468.1 alkene reductase [Hymenobacter sp. BT770]MDO3413956.1 alkene reductase [Hymenobacter sp. BT770]